MLCTHWCVKTHLSIISTVKRFLNQDHFGRIPKKWTPPTFWVNLTSQKDGCLEVIHQQTMRLYISQGMLRMVHVMASCSTHSLMLTNAWILGSVFYMLCTSNVLRESMCSWACMNLLCEKIIELQSNSSYESMEIDRIDLLFGCFQK